MCSTPAPPFTAFVASSIWSGVGDVNTSPGQAASSMPCPTKPPCIGSNDEVRVGVDTDEVRMRRGDALQSLGDDVVWLVDQLLHSSSTTSPRVSTSAVGGSPRA